MDLPTALGCTRSVAHPFFLTLQLCPGVGRTPNHAAHGSPEHWGRTIPSYSSVPRGPSRKPTPLLQQRRKGQHSHQLRATPPRRQHANTLFWREKASLWSAGCKALWTGGSRPGKKRGSVCEKVRDLSGGRRMQKTKNGLSQMPATCPLPQASGEPEGAGTGEGCWGAPRGPAVFIFLTRAPAVLNLISRRHRYLFPFLNAGHSSQL